MIKVAIIGCGKIADAHAAQIKRINGTEIVGVCDSEKLMAQQLSERFDVPHYYTDPGCLLSELRPQVVHITTPPQKHHELGKLCLEAGCHIYIEKPFAVSTKEAKELIQIAEAKNLKITVGHDAQFSHAARRMRELVAQGYLGGRPVHMESFYCYDLGNQAFAKTLLGDKNHWVRGLPGNLLQNIISHGVCRIAEFLDDDNPEVYARGFTSSFLRDIGESEIVDEVRVIIVDRNRTTAYFTFSSQMRPTLQQLWIYGRSNGIMSDLAQQTTIKIRGSKYKSYLEMFVPQFVHAKHYISNSIQNIKLFLNRDFHMQGGMRRLISSFYESAINDTPPPIPYREILLTSKIMDNIFSQLNSRRS